MDKLIFKILIKVLFFLVCFNSSNCFLIGLPTKCGTGIESVFQDEDSNRYGCKGSKEYNEAKRSCQAVQLAFYFANPKENFINLLCATGCPESGFCF